MELPIEVQNILQLMLKVVKNNSKHNLSGDERFELYEAFKPTRFYLAETVEGTGLDYYQALKESFLSKSLADLTLYWIAFLTLERIAYTPSNWTWGRSLSEDNSKSQVQEIIELARHLLQGQVDFATSYQFLLNQNNKNRENVRSFVNYNLYCVYEAAYYMLDFIVNAKITWLSYAPNEEPLEALDFAANAVNAQSAIDNNPTGTWKANIVEDLLSIQFDLQIRLEFWEWWLTEAIPEAWELAQQTYKP